MKKLTTFQIDKDTEKKLAAIANRNGWSKQAQIRHWCEVDDMLQKVSIAAHTQQPESQIELPLPTKVQLPPPNEPGRVY